MNVNQIIWICEMEIVETLAEGTARARPFACILDKFRKMINCICSIQRCAGALPLALEEAAPLLGKSGPKLVSTVVPLRIL